MIKYLFIVCLCICMMMVVGCTRQVSEESVVSEGDAPTKQVEQVHNAGSAVLPSESVPDVQIPADAESPSAQDVEDIKVPDVQVDATKGLGDIDETPVDGMDDTIDEP